MKKILKMKKIIKYYNNSNNINKRYQHNKTIAIAMSGGIDSAAVATILKQQGYNCVGIFMKNWDSSDEIGKEVCSISKDREDMRQVCERLKIPSLEVDFIKEYWNEVFIPFIDSYKTGIETPNPDIACNRHVKFNCFIKYVRETLKIDTIATGHYARLNINKKNDQNIITLKTAKDYIKDQSYFLCRTQGINFHNILFPLGEYNKKDIYKLMSDKLDGLNVLTKRESMGVCFIGKRDLPTFLSNYITLTPGRFIDIDTGEILGFHKGKEIYTIGQGAKISGRKDKYFVVKRIKNSHDIFVAIGQEHPALFNDSLTVNGKSICWISGTLPDFVNKLVKDTYFTKQNNNNISISLNSYECYFKIRHGQLISKCKLRIILKNKNNIDLNDIFTNMDYDILVSFESPQRAINPGQVIAFYQIDEVNNISDGYICLGGGVIGRAS